MKKVNNLFEKLITRENLQNALHNAMRGKRHYSEVKLINRNPEYYIDNLKLILESGKFKNSQYTTFMRKSGEKMREIYKLPLYPDRVLHHAIVQLMMPIWMKTMVRDTYATIPGRGIHDGVNRVKKALKDRIETAYTLKFDVKKYYPSVDHDILLDIISRKVKDVKMMILFEEIIRSAPGIPIGNYISQWFGNLYLAYFDHYCKEDLKCKHYFRYADDIVILHQHKSHLHELLHSIRDYLSVNLKLQIKENHQVFPTNIRGIDFLGYRFYHTHTLVRKSIVNRFKRKLHHSQMIGSRRKSQLDSYNGWFIHANTYNLRNKYEVTKVQ